MYRLLSENQDVPGLTMAFQIPDDKVKAIREGDKEAGYQLATSLVARYELEGGHVYKQMNDHWFLINLSEKDQAMQEILQNIAIHGEYEPETTKLFKSIVKEGDVAVDIGASIGYFTLLFARQVGATGQVYSFEPTKNQFPYLRANIEKNGYNERVHAFNVGAWDKNELVTFRVNAGARAEQLEGRVLDDILPEKVDFIKIDVDGSEPNALKGLIKTFERNPQLKMVAEYYPECIKSVGLNPQDELDILNKYFDLTKIEGDYNEEYWNYFCVRKNV